MGDAGGLQTIWEKVVVFCLFFRGGGAVVGMEGHAADVDGVVLPCRANLHKEERKEWIVGEG